VDQLPDDPHQAQRDREPPPTSRNSRYRRISFQITPSPVACRLFRPTTGAPVAVYLHGRGWAFGGIPESEPVCRRVADRSGWAMLSVDYRLAPEHPHPAALTDLERVLAALPRHAVELGVDTTRLAVAGDSAGANLAAAAAMRARGRAAPPWRLQVLLYPILDLAGDHPSRHEFATGYGLDHLAIDWHAHAYAPDRATWARPDVSPLRADTLAGLPPALVITAGCDPLRDEAEAYAARLADDGVPTVCTRYPGMIHGFADPDRFDAAHTVLDQIAGALRALWSPP